MVFSQKIFSPGEKKQKLLMLKEREERELNNFIKEPARKFLSFFRKENPFKPELGNAIVELIEKQTGVSLAANELFFRGATISEEENIIAKATDSEGEVLIWGMAYTPEGPREIEIYKIENGSGHNEIFNIRLFVADKNNDYWRGGKCFSFC